MGGGTLAPLITHPMLQLKKKTAGAIILVERVNDPEMFSTWQIQPATAHKGVPKKLFLGGGVQADKQI